MKEFEVTTPSGVIKVQADENATDAELISMAMQKEQSASIVKPKPSFDEKLLASPIGRTAKGWKDPIDAGAQLLPRALSSVSSGFGLAPNSVSNFFDEEAKKVDAGISDSERQYQTARWKDGQQGWDGGRLFGNVFNPATLALARVSPSGAATTIGRSAQGAVSGITGGLATPVTDTSETSFGMQKVGQAGTGALGGAIFAPVIGKAVDLLSPVVKKIIAKFQDPQILMARASMEADNAINSVLSEMGLSKDSIPTDVFQNLRAKVLDSFQNGQKLDAGAALRKADFDAQGVPALRGQLTRDPLQYSRDMNVRAIDGVGEPVNTLLVEQNRKIGADLAKFGGRNAAEPFQAGSLFTGALQKLDDRLSGEVSRAYKNARASSSKEWDIPMQGLSQDVQNVIDNFGIGAEKNAIPSAIAAKLKQFGILSGDGMTQRKVFNYEEADKLLKQINAHASGGSNASLDSLRAAVKKSILEGGGEGDPFSVPRKMAADRFKLLEAVPALEAVVSGKVAPDDFVAKFIVGGKVSDLKKLAEVLPGEAMDEARKQISAVILKGAFGNNAAGDKLARPEGLQSAIRGIGQDKLKVFFSDAEIAELNRLVRVTTYANQEPAWSAVSRGSNIGGALTNQIGQLSGFGRAMSMTTPILGALTSTKRVSDALSNTVPQKANLTAAEIAKIKGLLSAGSVGAGGLLAPGP